MKILKKISIIILIIFNSIFLCSCYDMHPIEDLSIVTGIGYDVEYNDKTQLINPAQFLAINKSGKIDSIVLVGRGTTIFSVVENRRINQSEKFLLGTEVVFLISEERAKLGIKDTLDNLLRGTFIKVNANIAICKGKCEDYFSLKTTHSGNMSEVLNKMIKFAHTSNFYTQNTTVNDLLLTYHQQGKQIFLPYIEIDKGEPKLTGATIFNDNKMIKTVPIKETKLINLLKYSGGNGFLSFYYDDKLNYIDMEGKNKVKIKVSKEDNHLKYDIFVSISGKLKLETLLEKKLNKNEISKIEKILADNLQKNLSAEVAKIQRNYKVDCLNLGQYAIAKYGRDSGYDGSEQFCNADIKVHVNIKIKSLGRIH